MAESVKQPLTRTQPQAQSRWGESYSVIRLQPAPDSSPLPKTGTQKAVSASGWFSFLGMGLLAGRRNKDLGAKQWLFAHKGWVFRRFFWYNTVYEMIGFGYMLPVSGKNSDASIGLLFNSLTQLASGWTYRGVLLLEVVAVHETSPDYNRPQEYI